MCDCVFTKYNLNDWKLTRDETELSNFRYTFLTSTLVAKSIA